jgi:choline kinase
LAARDSRLDVRSLFNPEFAERNNWWSVLRALREGPADGAPVAIVNADLLAAPSWVGGFLTKWRRHRRGAARGGPRAAPHGRVDEVELRPDGTLARIGKVGIDPGDGEYVGMLAAGAASARRSATR